MASRKKTRLLSERLSRLGMSEEGRPRDFLASPSPSARTLGPSPASARTLGSRSPGDGAETQECERIAAGGSCCSKKTSSEREFEGAIEEVVEGSYPPTPVSPSPRPLLRSKSMIVRLRSRSASPGASSSDGATPTPRDPQGRRDSAVHRSFTVHRRPSAASDTAKPSPRDDSVPAAIDFDNLGYLVGPGGGPLIGGEELAAALPGSKARVWVGSWNLAGGKPDDLGAWLRPQGLRDEIDIYALGIQEGPAFESGFWAEWEEAVGAELGPKYVRYYTSRLGVLVLSLFVRRTLIWFLTVPGHSNVMINPGNPLKYYAKTKGAVGVAFHLFKTSFLFLNSHLSYGKDNRLRQVDYRRIAAGMRFRRYPMDLATGEKSLSMAGEAADITAVFDRVFWFGDLNFGTDGKRSVVEELALRPANLLKGTGALDFSSLLAKDMLTREIRAGRVFKGFVEAPIGFAPTYKYDIGTSTFDSSAKQRVPAYTDRVLHRDNAPRGPAGPVQALLYTSIGGLVASDHKPVVGVFAVGIRPGGSLAQPDALPAQGHAPPRPKPRKSRVCTIF